MAVIFTSTGLKSVPDTPTTTQIFGTAGSSTSSLPTSNLSTTELAGLNTGLKRFAGESETSFRSRLASAGRERMAIQKATEQRKIQTQIKQRELAAEQAQVTKQKVFSGTVAGQLQPTPGQSVVDLPSSSIGQALFIGTGERKPSPKFDIQLIKQAGREFFFVEGTPLKAAGTLVSPLQKFFPEKTGELEFQSPRFGTISDQPLPFGAGGGEVTTGFELLRQEAIADPSLLIPTEVKVSQVSKEISRGLVSELQPEVTAGKITVEEAEQQFETQFEKRFEEKLPDIEKGIGFRERVGGAGLPTLDVKKAGELAAIGIGGLTPIGAQLVSTSFVAEGLPKVTGGETLVERGLGVAEIGFGLGIGGLTIKSAERAADISLLRELQAQEGLVIGKEIAKSEKGSVFDLKSVKQFGEEASIKTDLIAPVFQTAEKEFSITGGKGLIQTRFFSIEKGKDIIAIDTFKFGGRLTVPEQIPSIVSKDLKLALEESVGSFGTGFFQRTGKETFQKFKFGGISEDIETGLGKITRFKSGRLIGLELKGITRLRRKGLLFKEVKGKFAIEESGLIQRLTTPKVGEEFNILTPAKIKKTPLQVTFQELKIPAPTGIAPQIEKQLLKPFQVTKITPKVIPGLVGIPRAVGGLGLTEEQLQLARGGVAQQEFVQPGLIPSFDGKVGLVSLQSPKIQERQINILKLGKVDRFIQEDITTPRAVQTQRSKVKLVEGLKTGQVTKQSQILKTQFESIPPIIPITPRIPFKPIEGFDFGIPFGLPKLLGGIGTRAKPKKRATPRIPIRPSLTGIVLGIEAPAIISPTFGVLPGQIRGLETGFDVPKKKKKKKKKVKKKKK